MITKIQSDKLIYLAGKAVVQHYDLIETLMKEYDMDAECVLEYLMHLGAAYEEKIRDTVEGLTEEKEEEE